jgi:hypothetical protein
MLRKVLEAEKALERKAEESAPKVVKTKTVTESTRTFEEITGG